MTTKPDTHISSEILAPLLNRAGEMPTDGWHHLVARGDHPLRLKDKAGVTRVIIQRCDAQACEAIVADFNNRRVANPDYEPLVDFEHFSHDAGKKSEAAGWITGMTNRDTGVWFQARWSDLGEAAIKNRRYRFISPVWHPDQCERLGPGIYRPLHVDDAGLTNKPNLTGLTPFWRNRADEDFTNGREATSNNNNNTTTMNQQLIALLGLPADADETAILAATRALKEGSDRTAAEAGPLKNRLTALESSYNTLLGESITKELAANADVIPEGQVEAWKNRLKDDFAGTAALLRGLKRSDQKKTPVHDTGKAAANAAKKPATGAAADDEDDGSPFLNRVHEVMTADKLTKLQAIDKVAATEPALYREYVEGFRN